MGTSEYKLGFQKRTKSCLLCRWILLKEHKELLQMENGKTMTLEYRRKEFHRLLLLKIVYSDKRSKANICTNLFMLLQKIMIKLTEMEENNATIM